MSSSADLAVVGLGVMGANLARNFHSRGLTVAVYNRNPEVAAAFHAQHGDPRFVACADYAALAAALRRPRKIIVMVTAGPAVDAVVEDLRPHLQPGDMIIDGGNSHWPDTERRHDALAPTGLRFIGMGVSGGEEGALRGPSMMPGGDKASWEELRPLLEQAAAVSDSGPCVTWCGYRSAGHAVKMVHNGIEYGMMAAIAEGLSIIKHANVGMAEHAAVTDAETTPLRDPWAYQYDIDVGEVAEVWRRGSVISSWLVDLTAAALARSPELSEYTGTVSDSGEGRWTVLAAVEEGVPAEVITASLYQRFESRDLGTFTGKVLSAMRAEFGGHVER